MKKTILKINKNLKGLLLALAVIAGSYAVAAPAGGVKAAFTIGLVAAFKKKNITLEDAETKSIQAIEDELNDQLKDVVNKSEIDAIIEAKKAEIIAGLQTDKISGKSIEDILKEQGEAITLLKMAPSDPAEPLDTKAAIKGYLEKNKDRYEAFKRKEINAFGTVDVKGEMMAGIEIKAAGTMTIGGNTNSSAFVPMPEVTPGLVDLVRNRPFIEQYSNTSGTSSPRIVWTEKTNPDGEADFIGEGTVKPLIDFEIITRESYAKKVADKIKVSTEMLDDIDFIAGEIDAELKYQVDIKVDEELLAGAGDGTSSATTLKGLTAYAGGYVLTTISTTDPNNFDVIRACIAQLVSLNFNPTHLFINPIDGANMDLVKDANGRPIAMEYKTADGKIFRILPIETNQMPVGSFLIGDMSRFKVRPYKPFAIYMGWVNDDFEKNLVTIIGERRLHCYVANNHTGAFIYDQFADVKTAISAGVVNP